jgi:hypothetical protein
MHKEELDKEKQEELEEKMLDDKSQEELKKLAGELRTKKLSQAEEAIKKAESDEKKKADSTIEAPKAKASKVEEPTQPATKK